MPARPACRFAGVSPALASCAAKTMRALSAGAGNAGVPLTVQKLQIFNKAEAFTMLSNELLAIYKNTQATGDYSLSVDSEGDDVYTWNVWLAEFKQGSNMAEVGVGMPRTVAAAFGSILHRPDGKSPLPCGMPFYGFVESSVYRVVQHFGRCHSHSAACAILQYRVHATNNLWPLDFWLQDMQQFNRRWHCANVHLRVHYIRGLHPFAAPSVEIVRPHFQGPILGALASHPMLHQANWDPWRSQVELFQQIKMFLEVTPVKMPLLTLRIGLSVFPASFPRSTIFHIVLRGNDAGQLYSI